MRKLKNLASELKGFILGFALSLIFAGSVVFAWQAVWHGTNWITHGGIIDAQKVAENFEYLFAKTIKKDEIPICTGKNKVLQYNGARFVCTNISTGGGSSTQNCAAQTVSGQFRYTSCGCWSCSSRIIIKNYSCPAAKHLQTVTCTFTGYGGYNRANFQCVNGAFVQRTIAGNYATPGGMACGSCFTKETLITMADGTKKKISEVQIGDKVLGKDGIINIVKGIEKVPLAGRKLYSINGSTAFVTAEHPFLTKDGWKSIDPDALLQEEPSLAQKLNPKALQVGDVLITEKGEITITSIKPKEAPEQTVYNLILDGNNTYYANGFLVHNKD